MIDLVEVLTENQNPRKYWSVLKTRLKDERSQLATNCSQPKMLAVDGKYYRLRLGIVADYVVISCPQVLRLVRSTLSQVGSSPAIMLRLYYHQVFFLSCKFNCLVEQFNVKIHFCV